MRTKPKDYFKFSKIERKGIITLIVLILISLTYNIWIKEQLFDPNFERKAKEYFNQLDSLDRMSELEVEELPKTQVVLKNFDPNTTTKSEWMEFGLKAKQAEVILNYLNKGGKYRVKRDLMKMYSITEQKYKELEPYIQLPDTFKFERKSLPKKTFAKTEIKKRNYKDLRINVNTADSSDFVKIRGIGPVFSSRIIKYRDALGGFHQLNQISEVYGIHDTIYLKIKEFLVLDSIDLNQININTAEAKEIKTLPYFTWNHANAIVNYRKQHGKYKSLNDLHKVIILDSALINKTRPYLKLQD